MERIRKSWFEREEIKRITLDSLKINCKLTDRERELLPLIYDRKLVRRDFLEIISESYRRTGGSRTNILNRAINKMYKNMILDKVHEAQEIGKGNTPAILAIDRGGSLLLDVPHKPRIIQNKTIFKGDEYITRKLPANFRHIHGVNKLEVETILFSDKNDFKIVKWELEKPKTFIYNQEKITVIPDVLLILNIKGKPFTAFIEFDTGAEGLRQREPKVILDKIVKYKKYRSSNLWLGEEWQIQFDNPLFPLLLFVTEDAKRIDFFNRKSKELGVKSLGVYHENYIKVLEKLSTLI